LKAKTIPQFPLDKHDKMPSSKNNFNFTFAKKTLPECKIDVLKDDGIKKTLKNSFKIQSTAQSNMYQVKRDSVERKAKQNESEKNIKSSQKIKTSLLQDLNQRRQKMESQKKRKNKSNIADKRSYCVDTKQSRIGNNNQQSESMPKETDLGSTDGKAKCNLNDKNCLARMIYRSGRSNHSPIFSSRNANRAQGLSSERVVKKVRNEKERKLESGLEVSSLDNFEYDSKRDESKTKSDDKEGFTHWITKHN